MCARPCFARVPPRGSKIDTVRCAPGRIKMLDFVSNTNDVSALAEPTFEDDLPANVSTVNTHCAIGGNYSSFRTLEDFKGKSSVTLFSAVKYKRGRSRTGWT